MRRSHRRSPSDVEDFAYLGFFVEKKDVVNKLKPLQDVGLGYVHLGQSSSTLSGGEAQRIRLATQIGTQLTGVLYIMDEPSIGLHQRDNVRLIDSLKKLRDLGNTVLVVEHDKDMMLASDYVIDVGPGAGRHPARADAAPGPVRRCCRWCRSPAEGLCGRSRCQNRALGIAAEKKQGKKSTTSSRKSLHARLAMEFFRRHNRSAAP